MKPRKSSTKQAAQQYDITVKELLQAAPPKLLQLIWGTQPVEILTVDFPKVRIRHPDFIVRTKRGDIEQLEVQSDNDDDMEWRMLEYYPLLRKLFGRPPIQRVLYIGQKPLKMVGYIDEPNLQFRYEVIDLRQIDAELLLKSKSVEDRILAILCHADNAQITIRRILHSLSPLPAKIQGDKIEKLLILSRLRGLADMVSAEVRQRNAVKEILSESKVWMEWINEEAEKKAVQIAEKKTARLSRLAEKQSAQLARMAEKNAAQVRRDERIKLLTRQLETLYGKLPKWANEKIAAAQARTLEKWMVRLLKAKSLKEVLQ